jgi:hypothetical protein
VTDHRTSAPSNPHDGLPNDRPHSLRHVSRYVRQLRRKLTRHEVWQGGAGAERQKGITGALLNLQLDSSRVGNETTRRMYWPMELRRFTRSPAHLPARRLPPPSVPGVPVAPPSCRPQVTFKGPAGPLPVTSLTSMRIRGTLSGRILGAVVFMFERGAPL